MPSLDHGKHEVPGVKKQSSEEGKKDTRSLATQEQMKNNASSPPER